MSTEIFSVCKYAAMDETAHDGAGIANYNESVYFNFLDARTKVGGILRSGNRPNDGYREYSVNLKLPGGAIAFRAAREQSSDNVEFGCGGLRLQLIEAGQRWRLTFKGALSIIAQPQRLARLPGRILKSSPTEDCEIELEWNASTPMFVLTADGSGRATPGDASLMGTDHYEQFGAVSGSIRLGDRSWHLGAAPSMRDHTWGPRVWGSFEGEWMCGFLPDGTGMTLYSELQPSGKRAYSGVVMFAGRPHFVESFDVSTTYDGGADGEERYCAVLRAQGLPPMSIEGKVSHFSPLAMGIAPHRTRIASMVVEFANGAGGGAFSEFLRPLAED